MKDRLQTAGDGKNRFAWEYATRPLVEQVCTDAYPSYTGYRWTKDTLDEEGLDILHGIDFILELPKFLEISIQAKTLNQLDYKTVTIETSSKDSLGDWCTCRADWLCVIYAADSETIVRSAVINRVGLTLATAEGRLRWGRRSPVSGSGAQSGFNWILFTDILEHAPECVVTYSGDWTA